MGAHRPEGRPTAPGWMAPQDWKPTVRFLKSRSAQCPIRPADIVIADGGSRHKAEVERLGKLPLNVQAQGRCAALSRGVPCTAKLGTTGLWLPLSFPPVARAAAMVGNSEHLYFITGNRIDDGVRKVLHDETALPVKPQCAQQWVLQQELNCVLHFGEKSLR